MIDATFLHHVHTSLILVLVLSLPPLAVATVVGLIVGLLQAVTQIQDQTLPLVVKLIAVLLSLVIFGPLVVGQLVEHTDQLLNEFPTITR